MLTAEALGYDPILPQCPTGTLVSWTNDVAILAPAWCKRWACPGCGRRKAYRLAGRIIAAHPTRFLTLTCRRPAGLSPEEHLTNMNAAWRALWKRIKRHSQGNSIGYVKVVELHKSGSPHLHLAVTMPYLHQSVLSRWWNEITGSPIVDIRKIKSQAGLAKYLGKYLTKCTDVLAHHRKWSQSKCFLPNEASAQIPDGSLKLTWIWAAATQENFEAALRDAEWVDVQGVWWRNKPPDLSVPAV